MLVPQRSFAMVVWVDDQNVLPGFCPTASAPSLFFQNNAADLTVRTYKANPTQWVAAAYAMTGGHCGAADAYPEPHNVLFS